VDVSAAVVADEQSATLVEPGEGALDDPAIAAETGAVLGAPSRDHRLDPSRPKLPPVGIVVVTTVGDEPLGPSARASAAAPDRGNAVDERDQLGDVVAVAARQRPGKRQAAAVGQEVML
jgi:hypothetical protein